MIMRVCVYNRVTCLAKNKSNADRNADKVKAVRVVTGVMDKNLTRYMSNI